MRGPSAPAGGSVSPRLEGTEVSDPHSRVTALDLWQGPVDPQPLSGGITNKNYLVEDAGRRYVVRVGDDIPIHQVMRFNELAASLAAAEAGISPAVVHREPGVLAIGRASCRDRVCQYV